MTSYLSQIFTFGSDELLFDTAKSILLCREVEKGTNKWIKKLAGIFSIGTVIDDKESFFLSCESSDFTGEFLALNRTDGTTLWSIPGKSFMNVLHQGNLYLIFSDDKKLFYLIKVDKSTGHKLWHHQVSNDLENYTINSREVSLNYCSGKKEIISSDTGALLHQQNAGGSSS
ncbi:MAG TPA: hypothetical protein PK926_03565 [Spirochaetota bacterium]|nr:hypothetical protein [Spirochaetota bacterium]HPI89521.1 hypothetical protein [Spirochaetota bacterium]HPR47109.1 hypothetical protein [Spirochaetota bacterium]